MDRKETNKGCGMLVQMLKYHHPEYYNQYVKPYYIIHYKPLTEKGKCALFETSTTTIGKYKQQGRLIIDDLKRHYRMLKECIAISQSGYIIKESYGNSFRYRDINVGELRAILDFSTTLTLEVEKKNEETGEMEKKEVRVSFKPIKEIQSGELRTQLAYYHKTDLFTDEEGVLSRYVPPQGEANDKLAKRFIKFFENRIYNPEALHDMLASHAYRLRHPNVKIEKFFVSYSPADSIEHKGNTGKTFLASAFDMLYPNLSFLGAREKEAMSEFNSMLYDYLNVNFEELENENYRNQFFESFIKRSTNRKGIVRRLYHEAETDEIRAICSLNTNSNDLYGLIRADNAVISRLVILNFKPKLTNQEWDEFKDSVGLNDRDVNYKANCQKFAAAFYHYLRYTYEIPDGFNTVRYSGSDKDKIINDLRISSERLSMKFIKQLSIVGDTDDDDDDMDICRKYKQRGSDVVGVFISQSDLCDRWRNYTSTLSQNERGRYTIQSVIDDLKRLGWSYKRSHSVNGYCITLEQFNEWKQSIIANEEEMGDDIEWMNQLTC